MGNKFFESNFFILKLGFLIGIGDKSQKLSVGLESLRKETGLLLDFGKIIEILSFGGFEGDGLRKVVDSVLSIAILGINGSKRASDFGVVGI